MVISKPAAARFARSSVASFALLGLLPCGASSAAASGFPAGRDPQAPVCKARYVMLLSGYYRVAGVYELSNGDRLRVRQEGRRFVAEMGRTGRVEIVPLSENRFAEKGGPLRFFFNQEALAGQDDVTVTGLELARPRERVCGE